MAQPHVPQAHFPVAQGSDCVPSALSAEWPYTGISSPAHYWERSDGPLTKQPSAKGKE